MKDAAIFSYCAFLGEARIPFPAPPGIDTLVGN
jgi:hypothetical protein